VLELRSVSEYGAQCEDHEPSQDHVEPEVQRWVEWDTFDGDPTEDRSCH